MPMGKPFIQSDEMIKTCCFDRDYKHGILSKWGWVFFPVSTPYTMQFALLVKASWWYSPSVFTHQRGDHEWSITA